MYELAPDHYGLVKPLFRPLDHHLAVGAALDRSVPGMVYADHPTKPRSALVWTQARCFPAGSPYNDEFNDAVRDLLTDTIGPNLKASGKPVVAIHYASEEWADAISTILPGRDLHRGRRQYYERKGLMQDGQAKLPSGYSLLRIEGSARGYKHLKNFEALEEEMCSERPTVEEFLAKSIGVCLVHDDELVGWCLSEYNHGGRCEVGIEVMEGHQRRGLGTLLTRALVELALTRGVDRIGWHCWAGNLPSSATALKAGFHLVEDYPSCYLWLSRKGD